MYDLVIVGAGPTGLALAQSVAFANDVNILVVDSHDSVGGCHRVERVDGVRFTEHGPRVYSSSYKTFKKLLRQMNLDFDQLFTPYKFTISSIGGQTIFRTLSHRELFRLFLEFGKLMFNPNHGSDTTMAQFMTLPNSKKMWSRKSYDLVDRICRLTDGGGADKFSLNEFLELFNQQMFYSLYQPRAPNDIGLMHLWKKALERTGKVTFLLNSQVQELEYDKSTNTVTALQVRSAPRIGARKFVLAVPPTNIANMLGSSAPEVQNCFRPIGELRRFAADTNYDVYISITFHWYAALDLPTVYGFPWSEWGIIFVKLTDYMAIDDTKTVLSVAVSLLDRASTRTGKTANLSTAQEVIEEVQYQLSAVLLKDRPGYAPPDFSIISPTNYYDEGEKKWKSTDTAFISTSNAKGLPQTGTINNLYNAGTHNKLGHYKFTTLESAVQNGCILAKKLYPGACQSQVYGQTSKLFTIRTALLILIIILVIFACVVIWRNRRKIPFWQKRSWLAQAPAQVPAPTTTPATTPTKK